MNLKPSYGKAKAKAEVEPVKKIQVEVQENKDIEEIKPKRNFKPLIEENKEEE